MYRTLKGLTKRKVLDKLITNAAVKRKLVEIFYHHYPIQDARDTYRTLLLIIFVTQSPKLSAKLLDVGVSMTLIVCKHTFSIYPFCRA